MSHTTKISGVKIKDIDALQKAVADLKAKGIDCDLVQNAQPRMYYGSQHGKCDYVLKLNKGDYDVGFDKDKDGAYVPVYDEHMNKVGKHIGATCPMPDTKEGRAQHQIGQLMQGYAKHAAINQAQREGYMVTNSQIDQNGSVVLTIGGMR